MDTETSTTPTKSFCPRGLPSMRNCASPVMMIPAMRANPFTTPPAYFVTKPTTRPPNALVDTGIRVLRSHPESMLPFMSLLKYRLPSRNKMPYTASSAEKNKGWRCWAPTRARWVRAAERPESMEAPATHRTPIWYVGLSASPPKLMDPNLSPMFSTSAAVSSSNRATICMPLCFLPMMTHSQKAADSVLVWLSRLKVMESRYMYPY
mmetsp:Transcript_6495/g.14319  ORF Transcript_6495/g.14319 Transcript_6495/m.14319 type:complete len:207 (+) Transcript_6495:219-839(+)